MKIAYNMDISENSYSAAFTPAGDVKLLPFYVYSAGTFFARENYFTEREKLSNYMLIYTAGGEGLIRYGGVDHIAKPNTLMLIDCNEPHLYKTNGKEWVLKYIHFDGTAAKSFYELILDGKNNFTELPLLAAKDTEKRIESIVRGRNGPVTEDAIRASEKLHFLLSTFLVYKNRSQQISGKMPDAVRNAISYIEQNYSREISVGELSENAFLSKYYFIKLFKAYAGLTPYDYIKTFRINEAKKLLTGTDMPVASVSSECGFGDENNFIRTFKAVTGMTPLSYRKLVAY